jgi:excisionase family DNA binding protein
MREQRQEPYCTFTEAATLIGVTRQTVHEWAKAGRIRTREVAGRRVLYRRQVQQVAAERRAAILASLPVAS